MSLAIPVLYIFLLLVSVHVRAYYIIEPVAEQSSRDLDLNFFAGEPDGRTEPLRIRRPVQKIYGYHEDENPREGLEFGRASRYYETAEIPSRRTEWAEMFAVPERNRKLVKLNNSHKGEVILELRVTANNNEF